MPNLAAFLTYMFLTTFTPGPNTLLAMSTGSRHGFKKTIPLQCGLTVGFFLVMALSGTFSAFLAHLIPKIMPVMKYVGAAYILWLAWGIARSAPPSAENGVAEKPAGFSVGFFLQFVNIKVILFGITTFSTFITPYFGTPLQYLFFAALLTCCGMASIITWAAFGAILQKFFSRYSRIINIVLALLLAYCAVTLFL